MNFIYIKKSSAIAGIIALAFIFAGVGYFFKDKIQKQNFDNYINENNAENYFEVVKKADMCLMMEPKDIDCFNLDANSLAKMAYIDEALKVLTDAKKYVNKWSDEGEDLIHLYYSISDRGKTDKWNLILDQDIQWKGKIGIGLEQIDGIKFYFIGDDGKTSRTAGWQDWFWVLPTSTEEIVIEKDGWVEYMLKSFGNIDINTVDFISDTFLITGKYTNFDCGFYGDYMCVPIVAVEKIERIKNNK